MTRRRRSLIRAISVRWDAWFYLRCRVCGTHKDHLPGVGLCRTHATKTGFGCGHNYNDPSQPCQTCGMRTQILKHTMTPEEAMRRVGTENPSPAGMRTNPWRGSPPPVALWITTCPTRASGGSAFEVRAWPSELAALRYANTNRGSVNEIDVAWILSDMGRLAPALHVVEIEEGSTRWICLCGYEGIGYKDHKEAAAAADEHLLDVA